MPKYKVKNPNTQRNRRDKRKQQRIKQLQQIKEIEELQFSLDKYDRCEICLDFMPKTIPNFGYNVKTYIYVQLGQCQHRFHNECIRKYLIMGQGVRITQQYNANSQFKCPMEHCRFNLTLKEIATALKIWNMDSWIERVKQTSYICCKVQNCGHLIEYDKRVDREIRCRFCKVGYNPVTQNIIPQNLTKDELQMLTQYQYIKCQGCNYWIEQCQWVCSTVKCRCGQTNCYKCGGEYGYCACSQFRKYIDDFQNYEYDDQSDSDLSFDMTDIFD